MMKKVKLIGPIVTNFDLEEGMACKISHQMFTQSKLRFNIPIAYSYFVQLTEKKQEGKFVLPLDTDKLFAKE